MTGLLQVPKPVINDMLVAGQVPVRESNTSAPVEHTAAEVFRLPINTEETAQRSG